MWALSEDDHIWGRSVPVQANSRSSWLLEPVPGKGPDPRLRQVAASVFRVRSGRNNFGVNPQWSWSKEWRTWTAEWKEGQPSRWGENTPGSWIVQIEDGSSISGRPCKKLDTCSGAIVLLGRLKEYIGRMQYINVEVDYVCKIICKVSLKCIVPLLITL
jgi:hypothetical protein